MASLRMEPHYSKDRKLWNQAWERSLKSKFATRRNYPDVVRDLPALEMSMFASSAQLLALQNSRDQLVTLQTDLTAYLNAHSDFPRAWQATNAARREEIILEGLVRACDAAPDMEDRRTNCPETCLDALQRANGRGFLDLAEALCDPPAPEPRLVPHAAYDAMIGVGDAARRTAVEKVLARVRTLARNFFLTMAVWNTLLAFHGESENYRAVRPNKTNKEQRAFMKKAHPELYKEIKEDRKGSQWACRACGMMEDLLPDGRRLLTCAKCNKVARVVKYCDKNCQKADWPKHKPVCGKVFDAQDALDLFGGDAAKPEPEPAAPQDDDEADEFPTPEPPFAHSRHLKHQIRLLKENPQMDYLIVQPAPHPDFGLMLQDPMGRMMFLLLRRRAMQSGDTHAVLMMYKYLAECAQQNGVALRKVKDQLCLEYGVDAKMLDNASLD